MHEEPFYLAYLGGGGKTTTLRISTDVKTLDNLERQDEVSTFIYPTNFTLVMDEFGNTYYNATVSAVENDVLTVSGGADVNAFLSSIGSYTTLFITADASATAPAGALKMVVPADGLAQLNLAIPGNPTVILDADAANVSVLSKCALTLTQGRTVGTVEIDTDAAKGTAVTNNGTMANVDIWARTDFTNNGAVTSLDVGVNYAGGVNLRRERTARACGTTVTNNGALKGVSLLGQTVLKNNADGHIQALTVGSVAMKDDNGVPYGVDSVVVNRGAMCDEDGVDHDIRIYARCIFNNYGTIGRDNREVSGTNEPLYGCGCNVNGGNIHFGYSGHSDAHNGTVFNNYGIVYLGSRHNGSSHQVFSLWFWGVMGGYGSQSPTVTINNAGTIEGSFDDKKWWRNDYALSVIVVFNEMDPEVETLEITVAAGVPTPVAVPFGDGTVVWRDMLAAADLPKGTTVKIPTASGNYAGYSREATGWRCTTEGVTTDTVPTGDAIWITSPVATVVTLKGVLAAAEPEVTVRTGMNLVGFASGADVALNTLSWTDESAPSASGDRIEVMDGGTMTVYRFRGGKWVNTKLNPLDPNTPQDFTIKAGQGFIYVRGGVEMKLPKARGSVVAGE